MTTPQTLLQYIACHPGIRGIEIAEQYDIDLEQVERLLAPYVGTEVIADKVIVYGGAQVMEYRLAPPKPKIDRIEAAIRYIRQHGPTMASELSGPMGLDRGEYPTPMLRAAVKEGRLCTIGATYELPERAVPKFRKRAKKIEPQKGSNPLDVGRSPSGKLVIVRGSSRIILSRPEQMMVAAELARGVAP